MRVPVLLPFAALLCVPPPSASAQEVQDSTPRQTLTQEELDARVRGFLERNRRRWRV